MGMGKGVKPGLGHGASSVSFFFWGGEQGNWPFILEKIGK